MLKIAMLPQRFPWFLHHPKGTALPATGDGAPAAVARRVAEAGGFSAPKKAAEFLPSGKLTKNYGKSPFLMGKSTINGHFQ